MWRRMGERGATPCQPAGSPSWTYPSVVVPMTTESPALEFSVLGPLRIFRGGTEVELNAPMQRRLLLRLILDANQAVSRDKLQESLWPDAPDDKTKALRFHISKLRDAIDPERSELIRTMGDAYVLAIEDGQLDALVFSRLVQEAADRADTTPGGAVEVLDRAMGMWRGKPYSDGDSVEFSSEVARLEEIRLHALELRMDLLLETGRHDEAAAELAVLVQSHPLRERFRAQQMLALYRSGRAAEALRAYEATRRLLGEELGIEPSPALADLEERILLNQSDLLQSPVEADPVANTVPPATGPLIGRRAELSRLLERLDSSRLLTITGIAGVGKTRLTKELCRDLKGFEAVWWVDLVPLSADEEVAGAVADVVISDGRPTYDPVDALVERLRTRRVLLVVDNCEHVVAGVAELTNVLLASCPGLVVIATSRRPLDLKGESVHRVTPLQVPTEEDATDVANSEAVAFILELARYRGIAIDSADLTHMGSIVRRLEGIPLAMELAVARLAVLSPEQLDERLASGLGVLGASASDDRRGHQTMQETIEWSVRLLSAEGRMMFERLAAFPGGAAIEAIETVCADSALPSARVIDAIEELVSSSLVERRETPPGTRFMMLRPVYVLAVEALAESEAGAPTAKAHAEYYASLSLDAFAGLIGNSQAEMLELFDAEEPNLKAALEWARAHSANLAVDVACGLGRYWSRRGRHAEARRVLGEIIDLPGLKSSQALADVLGTLSYLSLLSGETSRSRDLARLELEVSEKADAPVSAVRAGFTETSIGWAEGDTLASTTKLASLVSDLGARTDPLAVYMLRVLGRRQIQLGMWDHVNRVLLDLDWWADQGHPAAKAWVSEIDGTQAYFQGELQRADQGLTMAIEGLRDLGTRHELAEALTAAANVALGLRDWDRAASLALEAGDLAHDTLASGVRSVARGILGAALLRAGRLETARSNLVRGFEMALDAPAMVEAVWAASFLAAYTSARGESEVAVILYSAADKAAESMGLVVPVNFEEYRATALAGLQSKLGSRRFADLVREGEEWRLDRSLLRHVPA